MIFGEIETTKAEGCILAHSLKGKTFRFKKGRPLSRSDIEILRLENILRVVVAQLSADDVHEAEAAKLIGKTVAGTGLRVEPPFTGRVNLFARKSGVMIADIPKVNALNQLDPSITFASLPNYSVVEENRMVATVKIIPFAAPKQAVTKAEALGEMVVLHPFVPKRVVLVSTVLEILKPSTMDKTARVLEERLKLGKSVLTREIRVAHDALSVEAGLQKALAEKPDLIILFGASATVDRDDVVPQGLARAGGTLHQFGMPVDPGNLLFLGALDDVQVLGAPGCARSPAHNGFDWILNRLLANIPVTGDDIMGMGVGGLLMEITSRPQPRENVLVDEDDTNQKVSAIVLAAGRSTRMGGPNKLLAQLDGQPLVRHVVSNLTSSRIDEIVVVTGHMHDEVEKALDGCAVRFVHNSDFADGLSTSLRAGIDALDSTADAALIALGDMPFVTSEAFNLMIDAYDQSETIYAAVATSNGKRGNPVLWSRRFFDALKSIQGDTGARHLIGENEAMIAEVEIGKAAALDLDTPEALRDVGGTIEN
ncbi:MAG: molybdopterin-binding/glycosyltransferase family 2 protein [Hyphomicrobiales bacterium]